MAEKNNNLYVKSLFKKGYVIPALFIALIMVTALIVVHKFGLVGKLLKLDGHLKFVICSAVFMGVVAVIYLFSAIKSKCLNVADCFYLAFIVAGVIYLIILMTVLKSSPRRSGFAALMMLVGLFFMNLRAKYFTGAEREKQIIYTKNSLLAYFSEICRKYAFITVLTVAGVGICILYKAISPTFSFGLSKKEALVAGVLALPVLAYLVKAIFDKGVNLLDVVIFASLFILPVILFQIIFLIKNNTMQLAVLLALFTMLILVVNLRALSIDLTKPIEEKLANPEDSKLKRYYTALSSKYGIMAIAAVGAIIPLIIFLYADPVTLKSIITIIKTGKIVVSFRLIMVSAVLGVVLLASALAVVFAILGLGSKKVNVGDFALGVLFVISLIGCALLIFKFTLVLAAIFITALTLTVIATAIRIKCVE
ncbi:MAG: hypothetical protein IJZ73_03830 [Clostridia bacterium]|nr:hypothetical protein [Clostridia bacterium]